MLPNSPVLDREGDFTVHKMEARDIVPLAASLCMMDKRELELLGTTPLDAMRHGFLLGSYVAREGGKPVAAFGVNLTITPAAIWFLGTDVRFRHPLAFQRLSRRWVNFLSDGIECCNVVPEDHDKTIRWLKSLDFSFVDTVFEINGHNFLCFVKRGPTRASLRH